MESSLQWCLETADCRDWAKKELVPEFWACPSAQKMEKDFREAAVMMAQHSKDIVVYRVCTDRAEGKDSIFLVDKS